MAMRRVLAQVCLVLVLAAMGVVLALVAPYSGGAEGPMEISRAQVYLPVAFWRWSVRAHLGYGANVCTATGAQYLARIGFDWGKGFVSLGDGAVVAATNQLRSFLAAGIRRVLLRLEQPTPPLGPAQLEEWQRGCAEIAHYVADTFRPQGLQVVAYEIWNEPNLWYSWGGHAPDAAAYARVLCAAYRAIKGADPKAIVVSGGLATAGDGAGAPVIGDLIYLRQMLAAGAGECLDAFGSHPYGGSAPPEAKLGTVYFRRAEEQRQILAENGYVDKPVWATEFGWVVEAGSCDLGEHQQFAVDEVQQADYLVRAFRYAEENWPWMGPMFIFNLDFGIAPWYERCDPVRWYSLLQAENGTLVEREAIEALRALEKLPRQW